MSIEELKSLFGKNFLGREQVNTMLKALGMQELPADYSPAVPYPDGLLRECAADYLLVLGFAGHEGAPLTILSFRDAAGIDPDKSEPCLYNQDWYIHEDFVEKTLKPRWYLLKKEVIESSRAVRPEELLKDDISFPQAILCVYSFFAYWFAYGECLWYHDFVWCSDLDHNGDRIYVGKYHDIDGVNKNGFSIHRHLALRPCYASITTI
ncbi:MAG: hypothetical protein J6O51_10400 [Bacteroidales bacterium]|nr:hypothetical protein [Bacteroidales bacterium]